MQGESDSWDEAMAAAYDQAYVAETMENVFMISHAAILPATVPEPAFWTLLALGIVFVGARRPWAPFAPRKQRNVVRGPIPPLTINRSIW